MIELMRLTPSEHGAPDLNFCVEVDPERHKQVRKDVLVWVAGDDNLGGYYRIDLRDPTPQDPEYRIIYRFDSPQNAVDMRLRFG